MKWFREMVKCTCSSEMCIKEWKITLRLLTRAKLFFKFIKETIHILMLFIHFSCDIFIYILYTFRNILNEKIHAFIFPSNKKDSHFTKIKLKKIISPSNERIQRNKHYTVYCFSYSLFTYKWLRTCHVKYNT